MTLQSLRFVLVGFFIFTILGAIGLTQAAPPRVRRARARAVRPHAARAHHARVKARKVNRRTRVGTYRPVVVSPYYPSSGGVVVIQDSGSTSEGSSEPVEESSNIEITPSESEAVSEAAKVQETGPSDADKDFAGQPSYKIVRLEDEGMTVVLKIEGQETKVRMIGVAAMDQGKAPKGGASPACCYAAFHGKYAQGRTGLCRLRFPG